MRSRREFSQRFLLVFLALACHCPNRAWAQAVLYSEDFEHGLGDWQVGDTNPVGPATFWGIVDASFGSGGAHAGSHKFYCAGSGGNPVYAPGMAAFASRALDLSATAHATLTFWSSIPSIEPIYDQAKVYLDDVELWSFAQPQTNWTQAAVSLDAYVGEMHTLRFEFTSDFAINAEGWQLDDIQVTDASIPGPPRPNAQFASAQIVAGAGGSVSGNNAHAGDAVWFQWKASVAGQVTFNVAANAFRPVLNIYTGADLSTLSPIVGESSSTQIQFEAISNVVYSIAIRGEENGSGPFLLNWSQPNAAATDLLPDLVVWADASQNYLYGWYLDRERLPGRTLLRLSSATANIGAGPLELIGSSLTPEVFQRVQRSDGGQYDMAAGAFTFHPEHGHIHFDDWLAFNLRAALPDGAVGPIVISGDKTSSAILDLQIYDPTRPGFPSFPEYHGGLDQGLSVGWADVYGADLEGQWIDITGIAPGDFWLEEIVDPANHLLESDKSNNVARVLIHLSAADLAGSSTTNPPPNITPTSPPFILAQPLGTNVEIGAILRLSVSAVGGGELAYQWLRSNTPLTNDNRISGAGAATLTIASLTPEDSGAYTVVVANASGSQTSVPANLIVLDNPRAVYVEEASATIGGLATVSIRALAAGDEHAFSFSLRYDSQVLFEPRVIPGADAAVADVTFDGAKIHIVFKPGEALRAGVAKELARVTFKVSSQADGRASLGFAETRSVVALNGDSLYPNFSANWINFLAPPLQLSGRFQAEGAFQISASGLPGRKYLFESTAAVAAADWASIATNLTGADGLIEFAVMPQSVPENRFYRCQLLPVSP